MVSGKSRGVTPFSKQEDITLFLASFIGRRRESPPVRVVSAPNVNTPVHVHLKHCVF